MHIMSTLYSHLHAHYVYSVLTLTCTLCLLCTHTYMHIMSTLYSHLHAHYVYSVVTLTCTLCLLCTHTYMHITLNERLQPQCLASTWSASPLYSNCILNYTQVAVSKTRKLHATHGEGLTT